MNPLRLVVAVLGRTVLLVELGVTSPSAMAAAAPVPQPKEPPPTEAPGPITDRVSAPQTQIGFTAKRRWTDGRELW
ncbi:MAG: hypothetical protein ACREQ5_03130 [Candidatus Dormibacteria bacterium]